MNNCVYDSSSSSFYQNLAVRPMTSNALIAGDSDNYDEVYPSFQLISKNHTLIFAIPIREFGKTIKFSSSLNRLTCTLRICYYGFVYSHLLSKLIVIFRDNKYNYNIRRCLNSISLGLCGC